MKIAFFTNNYLPNPSGVTTSLESFRQELERQGHTVYIFAPHWNGFVDTHPHVYRYPALDVAYKFRFPLPIPYSRKMNAVLTSLDLDIIHAHHPGLLGNTARRWARHKNIPLVFTWHTLYDRYTHFLPLFFQRFGTWWIIRQARRFALAADKVIAPSEGVKRRIVEWGVPAEHMTVVPTGLVAEEFHDADRKGYRKKYGLTEGDLVLLTTGRLTEEKNIEFLMRTALVILERFPTVKFLLGGDGYARPKLEHMARETGMMERVIFTGQVTHTEIKHLYAASDIFLCASTSETQGLMVTEAMHMGLPVAAIRATGIEDSVVDGETGFLVKEKEAVLAEAIGRLIEDGAVRKRFGVAGRKRIEEHFTAEVCTAKLLRVYQKTIVDSQ